MDFHGHAKAQEDAERIDPPGPDSLPVKRPIAGRETTDRRVALAASAVGALALGTLAIGALAIGAFAIGRLAIHRLRVGRSRIGSLTIGKLEVDTLRVRRLDILESPGALDGNRSGAPEAREERRAG